jgi:sulfopyruvate decarboxylase alpha subunit
MTEKLIDDSKLSWQDQIFESLQTANIRQIPYVPDAGHARVIKLAHDDPDMLPIVLSTEEEGVAIGCGAWLGGDRSVLLMQSSGVGNCINMLSLVANCKFPFVTIVTMRGEWGEFNSWQCPMGKATQKSLELMGITVHRCEHKNEVKPTVDAALYGAFSSDQQVAVLLSQKLIGQKEW